MTNEQRLRDAQNAALAQGQDIPHMDDLKAAPGGIPSNGPDPSRKDVGRAPGNTDPNWANCPSTHCERRQECCSPSECTVRTTGRKALLPAFRAHAEALNGGPLPNWPDDPLRWDERHGGLPYSSVMANRFRDFMAGFDTANRAPSADIKYGAAGLELRIAVRVVDVLATVFDAPPYQPFEKFTGVVAAKVARACVEEIHSQHGTSPADAAQRMNTNTADLASRPPVSP